MTINDSDPSGTTPQAGPDLARVLTEHDVAAMAGIDVAQVRLMVSGQVEIPEHLRGVIPEPRIRATGYLWHPDDAVGIAERAEAARARAEIVEGERRRQIEDAAIRDRIAAEQQERVEHDRRAAEQMRAAAAVKVDRDEYLAERSMPATRRERGAWWSGARKAYRAGRDLPAAESRRERADRAPVSEPPTSPMAEAPSVIAPSNTTRHDRAAAADERRAVRDAERHLRAQQKQDAREQRAQEKRDARDQRAEQKSARAAAAATAREDAAAAKAATKSKTKTPTATEAVAITPVPETAVADTAWAATLASPAAPSPAGEDLLPPVRFTAAERRAEKARVAAAARAERATGNVKADAGGSKTDKAKAAELKRADKVAAKDAKKARDAAYKAAIIRWKSDSVAAKKLGTDKPRRPKRPKNDTSKPKPLDVINAVRALAMMLENTPGELMAVEALAKEYEGTKIGEAFRRIQLRISEQNATLRLAVVPETIFPPEVHNMLRVGETTINAGSALRTAVKLLDAANDNKRKLMRGIGEPAAVGVVSLLCLFGMSYLVMPQFLAMYESLDMEIPPVSAAIMALSDVSAIVLGVVFAIVGAYALWWFAFGRRWDRWRTMLDAWSLHMPLVGKANQTQQTYQLIKILSSYMQVGSPERQTLTDAAAATNNRAVKKHLLMTADLMDAGRRTFAEVFDSEMFPNMARQIIGIGEKAGRVKETLAGLEHEYDREATLEGDQAVDRVKNTVAGFSSLIFMTVAFMASVPPLEMFSATMSFSG